MLKKNRTRKSHSRKNNKSNLKTQIKTMIKAVLIGTIIEKGRQDNSLSVLTKKFVELIK